MFLAKASSEDRAQLSLLISFATQLKFQKPSGMNNCNILLIQNRINQIKIRSLFQTNFKIVTLIHYERNYNSKIAKSKWLKPHTFLKVKLLLHTLCFDLFVMALHWLFVELLILLHFLVVKLYHFAVSFSIDWRLPWREFASESLNFDNDFGFLVFACILGNGFGVVELFTGPPNCSFDIKKLNIFKSTSNFSEVRTSSSSFSSKISSTGSH